MFRPLLKTIANMNGNVQLACYVNDYIQGSNTNEYTAYVRTANMLPLTQSIQQRLFTISLLESSYEYDLKKFYDIYSNYFYDSCFNYINDDFQKLDKVNQNYNRNKNFELGCKRLSYQKLGYQFCYFAPIYIEGINDIPDYFLLTIKLQNNTFYSEKTVKINVGYGNNVKYNYLYKYLSKYAKKIDDNFIYCLTNTKQATYFGVDLLSGTLGRKIDNSINSIYKEQMTINMFDNILSSGWKRNNMCMKQVIPLSFYFNINDFLTENEIENFKGAEAKISGVYYKNEQEVPFYDYDTDYTELYMQSIMLNKNNGLMEPMYYHPNNGDKYNILNASDPGLGESTFYGYRYTNKLVPQYNRWKLKFSTDANPYIINMGFGFSANQKSSYKYGMYPEIYAPITGISNLRNNLLAPLGDLLKLQSSPYYRKDVLNENYKSIMNKYCTTWFHSIQDVERMYEVYLTSADSLNEDAEYYYKDKRLHYIKYTYRKLFNAINEAKEAGANGLWVYYKKNIFDNYFWADVKNNKAYFGGILYDFQKINDELEDPIHLDKFAVFVKMNFDIMEKSSLRELKNATYTILTNTNNIANKNCVLSDKFTQYVCTADFYSKVNTIYDNSDNVEKLLNETAIDRIYIRSSYNTDPEYIDLAEYGIYVDDIVYFSINNLTYTLKNILVTDKVNIKKLLTDINNENIITGYEIIEAYNINNLLNENIDDKFIFSNRVYTNTLINNLYVSVGSNINKIKYEKKMFKNAENSKTFDNILYIKTDFITKYDLYNLAWKIYQSNKTSYSETEKQELFNELDEYLINAYKFIYKPIYAINGSIVARNIFLRKNNFTRNNYGNIVPTKHFNEDKDLIYVDQYNINSVVSFSNQDISYYNTHMQPGLSEYTYKSYYAYYVNEDLHTKYCSINNSYVILNDDNSYTMFARFLNQEHLHYYMNKICKNFDNFEVDAPQDTLYIRKRVGIYNRDARDFNLQDEYIPIMGLYPDFTTETSVIDLFMRIFNDFDYKNGCWYFSDICIQNHRNSKYSASFGDIQLTNSLFEYLGIDDRYTLKRIPIDLVFKKRFIKLNKELYEMGGVSSISEKYKDLYLYDIEKPYDYSEAQHIYMSKNEFIDDSKSKRTAYTTYDINNCLQPLFDDVKLQDKETAVFYKEYAQSKIIEATSYHKSPLQDLETYIYDNYYRYKEDDIHTIIDLSTILKNNTYIICEDPYTNNITYRYTYSYVNTYFAQTGWNLLDLSYEVNKYNRHLTGFNSLKKCESYLSKASTHVDTLTPIITYSYVDTNPSKKQIGYNTTYSYYSASRFAVLYPEERRKTISYSKISSSTYCVWTTSPYTYYPTVNIVENKVTYNYTYFDNIGLYNNFKLNTYIIPYSYNYYTLENITYTSYVSNETTGESYYVSYDVTQPVKHEYCGYYTYGFYLIDANFNNTKNSFKLVDIDLENKKYFSYLNGVDLYNHEHTFDFTYTFDIVMPFSKLNLFKTINETSTLVKPILYTLPTQYSQAKIQNSNKHDIIVNSKKQNSFTLERYFDFISPYFVQSSTINNSYMLKFKNVNAKQTITDDNDIMYHKDINIYNYEPIRIYSDTVNNKYSYYEFDEIEHHWFCNNKLFNLPEKLSLNYDKNIYENEIEILKTYVNTFAAFKTAIENNNKCSFTEDEILFLYNRYTVNYEYVATDYIDGNNEKLYTFTYKFILI